MPSYRVEAPYFQDQDEFDEHVERMKTQPGPSPSAWAIFQGLQSQAHIYGGTVDPVTFAERRKRNRHARRARAGNTVAIARQARLNKPRRGRRFARGQAPTLGLGGEA